MRDCLRGTISESRQILRTYWHRPALAREPAGTSNPPRTFHLLMGQQTNLRRQHEPSRRSGALDSLFAPAQSMAVAACRNLRPRAATSCAFRVRLTCVVRTVVSRRSRPTQHLPALSRPATRKALPGRRDRPPDRREKEGVIPSPRLPGPAARQQHVKPRRVRTRRRFRRPSVPAAPPADRSGGTTALQCLRPALASYEDLRGLLLAALSRTVAFEPPG